MEENTVSVIYSLVDEAGSPMTGFEAALNKVLLQQAALCSPLPIGNRDGTAGNSTISSMPVHAVVVSPNPLERLRVNARVKLGSLKGAKNKKKMQSGVTRGAARGVGEGVCATDSTAVLSSDDHIEAKVTREGFINTRFRLRNDCSFSLHGQKVKTSGNKTKEDGEKKVIFESEVERRERCRRDGVSVCKSFFSLPSVIAL